MEDVAELTVRERGILATGAASSYLDDFSQKSWQPVSVQGHRVPVSRNRRYVSRGQTFVIQWHDLGQELPAWFDQLIQGLVDLLTLPAGWSSNNDHPINRELVSRPLDVANELLAENASAPQVVPLASGGLQLEWCQKGRDLEIMFDQDEQPYFYFRDGQTGEELESEISGNEKLLKALIAKFD